MGSLVFSRETRGKKYHATDELADNKKEDLVEELQSKATRECFLVVLTDRGGSGCDGSLASFAFSFGP